MTLTVGGESRRRVGGSRTVTRMNADALIADLDADQRAAVTTESHLVAVIAGAGSGKTRVLTRRIAYRIAIETADPRHTLALTFTREAAGEMRKRLHRLGIREHVEAGTFHSVMLGVLKQRWTDTERRPLTVVNDRRRLVGDTLDAGDRRSLAAYLAEIDWASARATPPDRYGSAARRDQRHPAPGIDRCAAVYADYQTVKKRRGVIDFDDVLAHTIRDLRRDEEFADTVRWRFRHLLVDEAQDLNPLQHTLVDLLRRGRNDLFLVGDPSQAVYGFNGADPSLLVDVETRFPGIEVVRLPVNHRCTPQIVAAGVHVLTVTDQAGPLVSNRGDGPTVEQVVADDETDEARRVTQFIMRCDPNLVRTGEVVVLARTNAQLVSFADALNKVGLPVRRHATASGSALQTAVRQAAALGSASQLRGWAHDILDAPPDSAASSAASSSSRPTPAVRQRRPERHRTADPVSSDLANTSNVDPERRVAAAVLDFLREQTFGDGATFRAWVATTNPFDDASTEGVDLLTFHAAKGREWHTVVVTGVESSLVPHKSASTVATKAEEGRLLYVAFTRATDQLLVTSAARRGGYARTVSPFVTDLDLTSTPPAPPPARIRAQVDPLLGALRAWRDEAARRADVLPTQLCSNRDLSAIARERPFTADQLAAVTSFGQITAERLAPQILEIVRSSEAAGAIGSDAQSARSTITGA
jgi:DNA helicase-2/ATP-dependent DNA helicase PcrA